MKNKEIENGLEGIGLLENEISKIESKMDELVADVVQRDFPEIKDYRYIDCPFIHECKDSPFGWCVYDVGTDPASTSCLYCGKSLERK